MVYTRLLIIVESHSRTIDISKVPQKTGMAIPKS